MAVENNQLQSILLTALAQIVKPVCESLGIKNLDEMGTTLGGTTRQTVASIVNGSRPLTQAQGQCFCAVLDWLERDRPENKNYIRAVFNSKLPAEIPKDYFGGSWLDIWFRFFPIAMPAPIDLDKLKFVSYQVFLDPLILAEPKIIDALRPMTESMIQYNDFCVRWKQKDHNQYEVAMRSVEALDKHPEISETVKDALIHLQSAGVLQVCSDSGNDPEDPDEALLQVVRLLCRYFPVMVMTNRRELAKAVQEHHRKNPLPHSLRVVCYKNEGFMDWPELLQTEFELKVPAQPAEQEFIYQTKNWAAEIDKMFPGADPGENDPV